MKGKGDVKSMKCYNCGETGHIANACGKIRRPKGSCFRCGSTEHQIQTCPSRNKREPVADTTMNLLEPVQKSAPLDIANKYITVNHVVDTQLVKPYTVSLSYTSRNNNNCNVPYNIVALIDTGSPISLIKQQYVNSYAPCDNIKPNFTGINDSKLKMLGTFEDIITITDNVKVNIQFYVVPDNTMVFPAILGRDFFSNPNLIITLAESVVVKPNCKPPSEESQVINSIMHIDIEPSEKVSEMLNVCHKLEYHSSNRLKTLYQTAYVEKWGTDLVRHDFEMKISLKHTQPISFRPRRISFNEKGKLREILDKLLDDEIIRPSASPYASPIVLVNKKNGELRVCVDYREINKITIQNNFPTPLIDDHLDQLRKKKYFTSLDLQNGFHHVKMAEDSIKYTSFVTPFGQFEYLKMPFGLTNSPRVFQRFTNRIFEPLIRANKILLYLDDILIATNDIEEHLDILRTVFELAREYQLKFRLDKCYFLYREITYLGYLINEHGIRPSVENVRCVLDYPIPRTCKDVHRFIGLASYFRRFVPNFSLIAKPLYALIKKNSTFEFGAEQNEAFEKLKLSLANDPVLAIYAPNLETELHCDASSSGFGAILLQRQDDEIFRPVFYFSHKTSPAESKYHSFELECLAVIYAIKRFHIYLSGIKFKIITDCDSFRLTLSKQNVNPRISRWAMFLQHYDYTIQHRPGTRMSHVDALSRCHVIFILESNTFEQTLAVRQHQDEEIQQVLRRLEESGDKHFELRDGLVYRKNKDGELLFYVPRQMENNVIRTCHDDLGHVGVDKVIGHITRVYWFPNLTERVKTYITNCLKCIEFSPKSGKAEGYLHSIPKGNIPFQTVHVDHYGPLEKTSRGYKFILSVVDAFTKFIKFYPCKSTKSEETIRHLKDYFRTYSKPRRIISDRGTAFTSTQFKDFLGEEFVRHVLVATRTPRANGQVERFNQPLNSILSKLTDEPDKWDKYLSDTEFAMNNTKCRTTGETPSRLLFGIDQLGQVNDNIRLVLEHLHEDERDLATIRELASENIRKSQEQQQAYYNSKHKASHKYDVGDFVMIRNTDTSVGTNKKLIPKFRGPYVIKKVLEQDRYLIEDIEGQQLTQRPYSSILGPDQLKPYAIY